MRSSLTFGLFSVLKKREHRLRHEALGLRVLITSLDGGGQLLEDFDTKWRSRYGGEEADEVHDLSDGDDGDDDCSDDEQSKPRKKSRADISTVSNTTQAATQPGETLKRKRGRPRKTEASLTANAKGAESDPTSMTLVSEESTKGQPVGPQYLLGAFLFFSVFKSSRDYPSTATQDQGSFGQSRHHHIGEVLVHHANIYSTAQPSPASHFLFDSLSWPSFAWSLLWLGVVFVALMVGILHLRARAVFRARPKRTLVVDLQAIHRERRDIMKSLGIGGLPWELCRWLSKTLVWSATTSKEDVAAKARLLQLELLLGSSISTSYHLTDATLMLIRSV